MMTRREALVGAVAVATTTALPVGPSAKTATEAGVTDPQLAWGVGIDDEGSTLQFARTLHDAVMQHIGNACIDVCDACADGRTADCENGDGDYWCRYGAVEGQREPTLDHFRDCPSEVDRVALRSIGWCVPCVRCEANDAYTAIDDYPSAYDTTVVEGEGVVCHDCLEPAR